MSYPMFCFLLGVVNGFAVGVTFANLFHKWVKFKLDEVRREQRKVRKGTLRQQDWSTK